MIKLIFNWLGEFINGFKIPKYRLKPHKNGGFYLEEYGAGGYLTIAIVKNEEEAKEKIKNLERDTIPL